MAAVTDLVKPMLLVCLMIESNFSFCNKISNLTPVYPVLLDFVLKSSIFSGDRLLETGDKPSK